LAATFTYVWEYIVEPEKVDDFRFTYGPLGEWVDLFSQSTGYIKTELHRDLSDPCRFITVDYWISKESRDQFQRKYAEQFAALDKACELFTSEERFIGDFDLEQGNKNDA
jgi:quinol monooxygenase YgiN